MVQVKPADPEPPVPVALALNVWVPTARLLKVAGLVHAAELSPSSEHVTDIAFWVVQVNVAPVEVVGVEGVDTKVIVGVGVGGATTDQEVEAV